MDKKEKILFDNTWIVVSKRIFDLCNERNISINKLANQCNIAQSTIQNLIAGKSKNPKMLTIVRICDGLEISLKDFFDDKRFEDLFKIDLF